MFLYLYCSQWSVKTITCMHDLQLVVSYIGAIKLHLLCHC